MRETFPVRFRLTCEHVGTRTNEGDASSPCPSGYTQNRRLLLKLSKPNNSSNADEGSGTEAAATEV